MSHTTRVLSSLVLTIGLLGACAKKSRDTIVTLPDGSKKVLAYNDTLVATFLSEPPTLDWIRASDMDSALLSENIMEGLVGYDLEDPSLKLKPGLATNWTPEENGKKWTLSLRTNVKWTDGVEFEAKQVVDGWQRLLAPETASPYAYFLFAIKNAKAFSEGKIKDFSQVGVKIKGPYIIEVELDKPMSYFPMLLTHHSTFPIRQDLIDRHGLEWIHPDKLVTLGPYRISYWSHDSEILLERNDGYYGKRAEIKNVLIYIVGKEATALRLFDSGKIDFIKDLPTGDIQKISVRPEYRSVPGLRLYYYGFKTKTEPVTNVKVRKAIAHAIDREQLTKILGGGQVPLKSWVPSGMFGHDGKIGLQFNPVRAKQLLQEAGFGESNPLPPIVLGFNTSEKHQRVAENIQAQLKANLGITIELRNEEWKTYLDSVKNGSQYAMFRLGWVADYPDPDTFLSILLSFSDNNRSEWANKEFDSLVELAKSELKQDARKRLYDRAQKIIVEQEIPAIPLFTDVNNILVSQRIRNFPLNPLEKYLFKDVRIAR